MLSIQILMLLVLAFYFTLSRILINLLSVTKVLALVVVSIGVAVATVTDLQFDFFGACIALAWIIPSAVNKILWSSLQQQENWTAMAYVKYPSCILSFILLFFSCCIPTRD